MEAPCFRIAPRPREAANVGDAALLAAGGGEGKPAPSYGIHTLLAESPAPPPPFGEDRLGRRPSEKGVAGHGAPYLAPAADARRAGFDREPHARRPPPCPPPQGGRGRRASGQCSVCGSEWRGCLNSRRRAASASCRNRRSSV